MEFVAREIPNGNTVCIYHGERDDHDLNIRAECRPVLRQRLCRKNPGQENRVLNRWEQAMSDCLMFPEPSGAEKQFYGRLSFQNMSWLVGLSSAIHFEGKRPVRGSAVASKWLPIMADISSKEQTAVCRKLIAQSTGRAGG